MHDPASAEAAAPRQKISTAYEIGDNVKVLDRPFASFNGIVEELDFDRSRVKVGVSIFGRAGGEVAHKARKAGASMAKRVKFRTVPRLVTGSQD